MGEKISILDRLEKIDRRVIYLVLIIFVASVLLNPIGLPVPISPMTRKYYEAITSLPPGSRVLLGWEFEAPSMPENGPQAEATAKLLLKGNHKFVIVSLHGGGPAVALMYLDKLKGVVESLGKRYGEDYVLLPYIPGGETGLAALTKDFKNTVKNDYYGTSAGQIPLLRGIAEPKDFSLLICVTSGTPGVEEYLRQWVSPYGTRFLVGALGVSAAGYMPYYSSGQISGMLQGLRGAAELEVLMGAPSVAASSMDALSAGHLVTIAFILIGNLMFLLRKYQGKVK